MTQRKLVIGLDFGTTYSGVAYCDDHLGAGTASAIQLITSWPGIALSNAEKVPSRISYGVPPKTEILWGNLIKSTTKARVHALMKLNLDERLKKSKQLKMLLAFLTSNFNDLDLDDLDSDEEDGPPDYPGKDPVDLVADYLTEVRKHVWKELAKQYGEALLATLTKELVVTVPAVWSERAKDLTLKAVTKAKFEATKVSLVTEPEAAAVYTLKGMTEGANKEDVKVGDNFVVCDAGGGTVDLISYKITQTSPTFKVEEAAVGSGDKCGATYVDKEFLAWLEKWIGTEAYKKIPNTKTRHGSSLMNCFEDAKMQFSGEEDEVEITLPKECGIDEDEDRHIDDRVLTINGTQMKEMFDPCVNRALELIDGQVASILKNGHAKPKMVLVVGGFGRNKYLYLKICEYCQQRGIDTRTPKFPWSAVARGAVCRGLEGPQSGLVAVRLARKHYGTYASERFIPGYHKSEDMYKDQFTGAAYAKGQMTWLVDKGERLPESSPKKASIEVIRKFKDFDELEIGAVLVGCDEDDAPKRYADNSAYNICRVEANLGSVPRSKFMKARSGLGQEEHYIAEFKLEATFMGGMIEWKLIFDDKEYGSISTSYDN